MEESIIARVLYKRCLFPLFFSFALSALLVLLCVAGCENAPREPKKLPPVTNFRDIPGISPKEIAAIENILATRKNFTGTVMPGSDFFPGEGGQLQGFSPLLYEWLSSLFGIPFIPVSVEWDALVDGIEKKQFDFSVDIPTHWRGSDRYHATDTFVERGMKLFVSPLTNVTALRREYPRPRIGYLDMRVKEEQISAYLETPVDLFPVKTYERAQEMLLSGELDAFVGKETAETVITQYSSLTPVHSLSYSTVALATCSPELRPIISAVQKYLLTSGGYELSELQRKGYYQYLRARVLARLTEEEQAYIKVHSTPDTAIRTGIDYDNYPSSFYNRHEQQWQGIAVDILKEIQTLTGMLFVFANDADADRLSLKNMLADGEIAMTTELIRTPERKGQFLWTKTPYLTDSYALISLAEHASLNMSQVPLSSVGLIIDTAYADIFMDMFPNHNKIKWFKNKTEALEALEKGEIELVMVARNLLLSATNYHEKTGYRINLQFKHQFKADFGFNKEEKILCSIVSKTLGFLDTQEIHDSWTRRVFDYRGKLARMQVPYLVAVSCLLMLVIALMIVVYMNYRKKTRELTVTARKTQKELRKRTRLSYTDPLTGIHNRSKFDEELRENCKRDTPFCVLILDIDHFKQINDTYGHLVGDKVLVHLVKVIMRQVRSEDVFARWGGEEFVILQRSRDLAAGTDLATRLRTSVEIEEFGTVGKVTISLGTTAFLPGDTPEGIMHRADCALYRSKEHGRNAVTAI